MSARRVLLKNEFRGTLVSICPGEDLQFKISDLELDVPTIVKVTNITQEIVSFKVVTFIRFTFNGYLIIILIIIEF